MSIELTIEEAIGFLCKASMGNYYAYTMNTLERVYTHSIDTFCVMPKETRYVMMINPDFAGKQPFDRLVAIIEHEVLHIVLAHAPRSYALYSLCETDADRRYFFLAKPIAVDAAVNEFVRQNHKLAAICPPIVTEEDKLYNVRFILPEDYNLPRGGSFDMYTAMLMTRFREMLPDPERLIAEVVAQLKKQIEAAGGAKPGSVLSAVMPSIGKDPGAGNSGGKGEKEGEGSGAGEEGGQGEGQGGGGGKDEFSSLEKRLIADLVNSIGEHLSEYLEDVTDAAKGKHLEESGRELVRVTSRDYVKARGTLPSALQQLIDVLLQPPTVSWTELFAAFIQNAQKSRQIRGMRRVSKMKAALQIFWGGRIPAMKRLPLFPGTERDVKFVVWFVVDTSGSMSMEEIAQGLSELQHVQRAAQDMEIHVLYVDAGVGKHYQIGPFDELDYGIVGRGGTDFEVAFKYVAENTSHIDLMVYVTDGYAPNPTTKLPCQTIWLLTANGKSTMYDMPGHTVLQMRPYGVGETL